MATAISGGKNIAKGIINQGRGDIAIKQYIFDNKMIERQEDLNIY
jgi:hypothetical protein